MIVNEDRKVVAAVQREKERIAHGVEIVTQALRKGGRIFFIGAGTSGRLGVVEAAEMPPTFGTARPASRRSWPAARTRSSRRRKASRTTTRRARAASRGCASSKKDVVIGVSASGMTPFVRGGADPRAQGGRADHLRHLLAGSELQNFVDLQIAPAVGPEMIAGSTRLKAGTATKMVLNMLTTIAMIKLGKTYGNLMVDVKTGIGKAQGPRAAHRDDRHRGRLRGRRRAAEARQVERQGPRS